MRVGHCVVLGCYPKGAREPMEGFQEGKFTVALQPECGGQHTSYYLLCFQLSDVCSVPMCFS